MLPDPVVLAHCYKTLVPYNMVFLRLWIFSFLSFFFFFWTPGTHPLTFVPDCTPVSVWRIHSALLCKDSVVEMQASSFSSGRRLPATTLIFMEWICDLYVVHHVPFRDLES